MSERKLRRGLPVIAMGASAGGLEPSKAMLEGVPGDARGAFILILHLDSKRDSLMVDLLAGHAQVEVVPAQDGVMLRAGVLHVVPPDVFLTVEKRRIRFSDPEGGKGVRLPFDALLRSLAKDGAKGSACVILSGTGTDGSLGLADFKAAGGAVIAQAPADAQYDGMPKNAIATGLVDQTMRADQMVTALAPYIGINGRGAGQAKVEVQDGTMRCVFQADGWTVETQVSPEEFLAQPGPNGSGYLLTDDLLPSVKGVEVIEQLQAEQVAFPAIILTGHADTVTAVAALKAGAFELIEKPASAAEILAAVRLAMKSVDHNRQQAETRATARKRFSGLTAREREVLRHVLSGAPNKIIAVDLGLNQRTVESHRASVMRKAGVRSLPELVRLAFAADLDRS